MEEKIISHLPIRFVMVIAIVLSAGNISWAKTTKNPFDPRNQPPVKIECKNLSVHCAACSDGAIREPHSVNRGRILKNMDAYACATSGLSRQEKAKLLEAKSCKKLSNFCSVCPDGSFVYSDSTKIRSDLYECSTTPRTQWVKVN